MEIKHNGRYVKDFEYIMNFKCSCGCEGKVIVEHNKNNNALQVRCADCNKFHGNFKYDFGIDFGGATNASQTIPN